MAVPMMTQRRQRRREATDRKIADAVMAILVEDGVAAVTIEEVARRSGVAKTTIYRRYRNTEDLLNKLPLTIGEPLPLDDLDASPEGVVALLTRLLHGFDEHFGLRAVGLVLSSRNTVLRGLALQVLEPAEQRFAAFVRRGQQAHVFLAELDVPFLFRTLLGSMLANRALAPTDDDDWVGSVAALLWQALTGEPAVRATQGAPSRA
ncbi:TetR/AcrR family transcriptional regulator [Bifidobacterium gallicum]|nr:TetR/AcrR family transcriptional regulator [Bifidobacterium gallicum]KFI60021.1 transcriptional regulator, TetR family [Bifidobacterium gallicum DSM 20093 = LMG 11596]